MYSDLKADPEFMRDLEKGLLVENSEDMTNTQLELLKVTSAKNILKDDFLEVIQEIDNADNQISEDVFEDYVENYTRFIKRSLAYLQLAIFFESKVNESELFHIKANTYYTKYKDTKRQWRGFKRPSHSFTTVSHIRN